jgi:hypothetical protein
MIDFNKILEEANKKYASHVVNVLRLDVSKDVSAEVVAMGKAIVEAINKELEK